jgi:dTDP-4-dehydrorhamnose 3,5-epimerase-like enzyme
MESLSIGGAWAFTAPIHRDDRGSLHEWYRGGELTESLVTGWKSRKPTAPSPAAG